MEDVRAMTTSLFVDDLGMLTATKRDGGWYIDWMVLTLLMQIQAISPLRTAFSWARSPEIDAASVFTTPVDQLNHGAQITLRE